MSGGLTLDPSSLLGSQSTQIKRRARHMDIGAVPVCAGAMGETIWLACGDGQLRLFAPDGLMTPRKVHRGAILSMAVIPDAEAVLTGGDDGRFLRMTSDGTVTELAHLRCFRRSRSAVMLASYKFATEPGIINFRAFRLAL